MKKIYLIRHCQASGQDPDAGLTPAGEKQALRLAEFLSDKEIDAIVSSPYERAVSTIRPFANTAGLHIVLDERLSERVLTGHPHPDWLNMLERSFADPDLSFTGGESGREASNRGAAAINDILGKPDKKAAIITHGNLMALILKNYDSHFGFAEWKGLSNPDVYEIIFDGGEPKINRVWKEE